MLMAQGDDLLRIQGLEEVAFSFEYSDRHRNAKRYRRRQAQIPMFQRIILMRTWNRKSCACDPVAVMSRRQSDESSSESSDTDEGSTSDEEEGRLESFKAPEGVLFYDVLPVNIEEDFSLAFGSRIAHTFTTGWEIA